MKRSHFCFLAVCYALSFGRYSLAVEEDSDRGETKNLLVTNLQGTWRMACFDLEGINHAPLGDVRIFAKPDAGLEMNGPGEDSAILELDQVGSLGYCTLKCSGYKEEKKGIYRLTGNNLKVAFFLDSGKRPKSFQFDPEDRDRLVVYSFCKEVLVARIIENLFCFIEEGFLQVGDFVEDLLFSKKEGFNKVGQIYVSGNGKIPEWRILEMIPLWPGRTLHFWRISYAEMRFAFFRFFHQRLLGKGPPLVKIFILNQEQGEFHDIQVEIVKNKAKGRMDK